MKIKKNWQRLLKYGIFFQDDVTITSDLESAKKELEKNNILILGLYLEDKAYEVRQQLSSLNFARKYSKIIPTIIITGDEKFAIGGEKKIINRFKITGIVYKWSPSFKEDIKNIVNSRAIENKIYPKDSGGEVSVMNDYAKIRLEGLNDILKINYEKLNQYQKRLSIVDSEDAKFSIRQTIKTEIKPTIKTLESEYAIILAGELPSLITSASAEAEVLEFVKVIKRESEGSHSEDVMRLLTEILDKLNQPNVAATAKLQAALPIIPGIISYKLDLDSETTLIQIWQKIKSKLIRQ